MKFECDWKELREASELAAFAVPAHASYLSLTASGDHLRVEGGSPTLQVAVDIAAEVRLAGQRAVSLRPWLELMRLAETVTFECTTVGRVDDLVIPLRGDKTSLRTIDAATLSLAPPLLEGILIELQHADLVRAIRDVVFVISPGEGSSAVRVRAQSSSLEVMGIGGSRASWSDIPLTIGPAGEFTVLAPPRVLELIQRIPGRADQIVSLRYQTDRAIGVTTAGVTVRSGVLDVPFPDLPHPAETQPSSEALVDREEMLREMQFAQVFAEDRSVLVTAKPSIGISIEARSDVVGNHRATVAADWTGDSLSARLHCGHLLDVLRAVDDPTLRLTFEAKRAVIRSAQRPGFAHVLAYMRESV